MRRQVDTPCKRRRTHEDLDLLVRKEPFGEVAIRTQHAGVVDAEAVLEELLELAVARTGDLALHAIPTVDGLAREIVQYAVILSHLFQRLSSFDRVLSSVHEYHRLDDHKLARMWLHCKEWTYLVTLANEVRNFLECDGLEVLLGDGTPRFAFDTDKVLLERNRAE